MPTMIERIISAAHDGRLVSGIRRRLKRSSLSFLKRCRGVIHVGANDGAERPHYAALGLNVIWIEPIPEVFDRLVQNLSGFRKQRAIRALVTDIDDGSYKFHVASNDGNSSSIFDLQMHKDIWPDVTFTHDIMLTSSRLSTALAGINLAEYDSLILDTQGSELLILQGATSILSGFNYILVEAADFEAYRGGATVNQITDFLRRYGFRRVQKYRKAAHPSCGRYYDILFQRGWAERLALR